MTNWKWQRTCHGPASEAEPVNGNKLQAEAQAVGRGAAGGSLIPDSTTLSHRKETFAQQITGNHEDSDRPGD